MSRFLLGFIGCGHMGGTLAAAASGTVEPSLIAVSGRDCAKNTAFAEKYGFFATDNNTIAANSDFIVIGVKPQNIAEVLGGIAETLAARTDRFVVVSMAAGVTTGKIANCCGNYPIIRIMPNTPAAVGEGTILYCGNALTDEDDITRFSGAMRSAGAFFQTDETLMDAGCSVSGCGPAFAYMFIDALAKGGASCGLDYGEALRYACATVRGAAKMIENGSFGTPEQLTKAVCSPGGSTIEGVKKLENGGLYALCTDAVKASYKRNKELG